MTATSEGTTTGSIAWLRDLQETDAVRVGGKGANLGEIMAAGLPVPDGFVVTAMPPNYSTWLGLHGEAKLTRAERALLADGLRATLAGWRCGDGEGD